MTEPKVIAKDSATISEIRPFLHLSGLSPLTAKNLESFTCIINCVAGLHHSAPSQITVVNIPVEDEEQTDLSPYWQIVFETIEEQRKSGGKVLIFCGMGISRSASFVVAYLMCIEKMTLRDAYKHVQRVRNIICPNVGFFKQMIELEAKLFNKTTVKIIEPIAGVEVADVVWNELYEEVFSSGKNSLSLSLD